MQQPLSKIVPQFIESLKTIGRSPATILAYRADLEQLSSYLISRNKVMPQQVRLDDLESFRDWLLSQKYTPKSTSRKLNAVKTFFRWLTDQKVVANDPSKDVGHPKIEVSLPKYLSQLEYRALRDVVRSDHRISEVANLKLQNIKDLELKIESYATQPERTIPLNNAAKEALESYLKDRPKTESPYLFVSKNGKPLAIRNIRAAIDRYMQKAEIGRFSVNDLRTTFIIENLKRGVDLVTISQVAGHKRLSTTERYLEIAQVKEPGKKQKLEEL